MAGDSSLHFVPFRMTWLSFRKHVKNLFFCSSWEVRMFRNRLSWIREMPYWNKNGICLWTYPILFIISLNDYFFCAEISILTVWLIRGASASIERFPAPTLVKAPVMELMTTSIPIIFFSIPISVPFNVSFSLSAVLGTPSTWRTSSPKIKIESLIDNQVVVDFW